ncbi:MAG TPA: hypothetical protein VFT66_10120 [Roseiflexaceae bacterium]|nr:hypothetical protein [Roseiflexaceae bacterium]
MKFAKSLVHYHAVSALSIVLLFGMGTFGWLHLPMSPRQELRMNQQRWSQRPFSRYRITLQIENYGRVCHQEFVMRDEQVQSVMADTCNIAWLSDMSVTELFDINERIDRSSSMHCYPSENFCTCRRVTIRHVMYDPRFGYPELIVYGRAIEPNWMHADFWRRWLLTQSMPNCSMPFRSLQIAVTSLTPLP